MAEGMDAPEQEAKKPGFFKKVNQFVGGFFKGAPESTPQSPVQAVPVAEYAGIKVGDKVTAIGDKAALGVVVGATAVGVTASTGEIRQTISDTTAPIVEKVGDFNERLGNKVGRAIAGPDIAAQASRDIIARREQDALNAMASQPKGQPEYGKSAGKR